MISSLHQAHENTYGAPGSGSMSVPLAFPAPRVLLELMPTTVARNGLTITPQTIAFMYSPVVTIFASRDFQDSWYQPNRAVW